MEGPGHCGACHTPRSLTMQEKAPEAKAKAMITSRAAMRRLTAGSLSSLRGENRDGLGTTEQAELAEFLKTGRNDKSVVFGGMSDVVSTVRSISLMTTSPPSPAT